MTDLTLTLITVATWLTPLPIHAEGRIVLYGGQALVEANADFRGYDLAPYADRCGLAVMSPADLGKIVWLRAGGDWYGPCLAVDVARRSHFVTYVNDYHEIAEVSRRVYAALELSTGGGDWGETFVGYCPPDPHSTPADYVVAPEYTADKYHPSFYPYPTPQLPIDCGSLTLAH